MWAEIGAVMIWNAMTRSIVHVTEGSRTSSAIPRKYMMSEKITRLGRDVLPGQDVAVMHHADRRDEGEGDAEGTHAGATSRRT